MNQATDVQFTAAERDMLAGLAAHGLTVETCADDGPEWAAVLPTRTKRDPFSFDAPDAPVFSVQLTDEPDGRCVVLGPDGRDVLATGDDLAEVLAAAGIRQEAAAASV